MQEILGKIIGIRTSSYKYWRSRDDPKQNISLFHLHEDPKEEKNIVDENIFRVKLYGETQIILWTKK